MEYLLGITAIGYYSSHDPLKLSDLECGVIPGLASLGHVMELVLLDNQMINMDHTEMLLKFVRQDNESSSTLSDFALEEVSEFGVVVENIAGVGEDECERYYVFKYGTSSKVKSKNVIQKDVAARHAVFTISHPELIQCVDDEHMEQREMMSLFLLTIAGNHRDRVCNRIRRASQLLVTEPALAVEQLIEAAVMSYQLPEFAEHALLWPGNSDLNGLELREISYFARAGKPTLRAICAYRLSGIELESAQQLLSELAYDPDPWVRIAAGAPRLQ